MKKYLSLLICLMILLFATASFAAEGDISCKDQTDPVCLDQSDPCACVLDPPPPMEISGEEAAVENVSVYTPSGGRGPYAWSFDKGSIDNTGKITSINACSAPNEPRWGTVSVTDVCGQTTEMKVRLPGGKWVSSGSDCVPAGETCGSQYSETGTYPGAYCDIYNCYCTPANYYQNASTKYSVCRRPGWLGSAALTCSDGRVSTCWAYYQQWVCQ